MTKTKAPKLKINFHNYSMWGVEKYGCRIELNPTHRFKAKGEWVIDVENYKDGRFAGLGLLKVGEKKIFFWTNRGDCKVDLSNAVLIGHVLRTDIHKLQKWGFRIPACIHYDTALIEHLMNSTKKRYGLKELVKEKFGIEYPSYEQIVGDGDFDSVPIDVVANYNGMDLIATYKLYQSQTQPHGHL